jgi:hypothetical protein
MSTLNAVKKFRKADIHVLLKEHVPGLGNKGRGLFTDLSLTYPTYIMATLIQAKLYCHSVSILIVV